MTKNLKFTTILALVLCTAALAACNTVEGAGEDVSNAGDAVADTARDAKN